MIDKNDFKALFEEYYDAIRLYIYYKIADKEAANDMAQDVFVTVWEKRGDLNVENIKALLYRIASGRVVDFYRNNDVKADFRQWVIYTGSDVSYSTSEQTDLNETMQLYAEALGEMTEGQREVFMMSREENMTYREIAERLGVSVKAVEKRMTGALKILNEKLLTC